MEIIRIIILTSVSVTAARLVRTNEVSAVTTAITTLFPYTFLAAVLRLSNASDNNLIASFTAGEEHEYSAVKASKEMTGTTTDGKLSVSANNNSVKEFNKSI